VDRSSASDVEELMKYALCVGNNYPGTDNELAGCVNDMNDWADLLDNNGYDVHVMEEASAENTLYNLHATVGELGWGDRLIFTYSGHGTWMPDQSGDESDFRDEALYMADGSLIMDDELNEVWLGIPYGAGVLTLSDSCHSGTVTRFAQFAPQAVPRFISPAQFTNLSHSEARDIERVTTTAPSRKTSSLISGCADEEYSYDAWFGGRANGAFSRAAIDAYTPGASLARWFNNIRVRPVYPQTPQLTAASLYRRYAKAL
jgi:hypothetical protein